ncbi:MAG: leucine-rich repeat protein [Clostridia bacterium]|nr:leucine-rich repeat protein [Clostridia bacterium]
MKIKKILPAVMIASIFSFAFGVAACTDGSNSSSSSSSSSPIQEKSDFTFTDCGEYYSVNDYTGTATEIVLPSAYNGKPVRAVSNGGFLSKNGLTKVTFPDSITQIGDAAFSYCRDLTTVELSPNVSKIGASVFYGAERLQYAEYGNAYYLGGAGNEFHAVIKPKTLDLQSLALHDNAKVVADAAFYYCTRLAEIDLNGVKEIGATAFAGCYSLTELVLPNSLTEIGENAFGDCYRLVEIKNEGTLSVSAGANTHGNVAYYAQNVYTPTSGASRLTKTDGFLFYENTVMAYEGTSTEIVLPATATEVWSYAFADLASVQSIDFGSVTKIGIGALYGCSGLRSLITPFIGEENGKAENSHLGYLFGEKNAAQNAQVVPKSLKTVTVTSGEKIFPLALNGCTSITNVVLPNGLQQIGENAFSGCTSLVLNEHGNGYYLSSEQNEFFALISMKTGANELVLHADSKLIADGACQGETSLWELGLASVQRIGRSAFEGCYSLVRVSLPETLLFIGNSAFKDCPKLVEVKNDSALPIEKGLSSSGYVAYYAQNVYSSQSGESALTETSNSLLYGTAFLSYRGAETSFAVPSNVTELYDYAFAGRSDLTALTIGDGVEKIGENALTGCDGLTALSIPFLGSTKDGIEETYFGYLFGGYSSAMNSEVVPSSLKSVTLTSVETLNTRAFERCLTLERVSLPATLANVGDEAFRNCPSLVEISVAEENTRFSSLNGDLYDKNQTTILQYAVGKTNETFTLPESVLTVKKSAFEGAVYLQQIHLSSVQLIGTNAFRSCQNLTSIVIPESVVSVGQSVFDHCPHLKIFLCAASVPLEWSADWNVQFRPVYLGGEWTLVSGVPVPNETA